MRVYENLVRDLTLRMRQVMESEQFDSRELDRRLEILARDIIEKVDSSSALWRHGIFLDKRINQIADHYEFLDRKISESTSIILEKLDAGADRAASVCRLRSNDASNGIAKLIVTGGPSIHALERGRAEADGFLKKWVSDAEEITVIDPFLFKREKPSHETPETEEEQHSAEVKYANELLMILGKSKKVNFIYKGNPDKRDGGPQKVNKVVAETVANRIGSLALKSKFFVVDDLHDRVWIKRTKKQDWHALALGTSRGGIGKRPTYILPMSADDCESYMHYVESLMHRAQLSHERPIDFKRPRETKKSNSGKVRRIGG